MKEVLKFFSLASLLISIFFSGCTATNPLSHTSQNITVTESIGEEERVYFPNYNLSISKPPQEWVRQKDLDEGELVIWLNREAGSIIEIMASRAVKNLSYHNIAAEFNRITCNLVQQRSPSVICTIIEEKEVHFNSNQFYRVKIVYQGVSRDITVKSTIYLLRADNYVYHFLFMEEKHSLFANAMMQSLVIHENQRKSEFFQKTETPISLIDACYYGDLDRVKGLLNADVDINARDKDGVTALAYASDRGHMAIVRILLANNADVNTRSNIGSTALMNASYMGHVGIVNNLIARGADVNAQSNNGTTALMNAAAQGYREIVKILLANDANVDACDECGLNALWNAISSGHCDIVKILINNGVDVNKRANDGTTALMNAAFTGNIDMVKMLLEANAEINAKAANGWTALILAKSKGYSEIVKLLVDAGAFEDSPIEPGIYFKG